MGFIQNAVDGAVALSLDRVRRGEDHGQFNPRPVVDLQQQAEFVEQQRGGRTDEPYRQCLTYYGFVWRDIPQLPMLEGGVARTEGEWRNRKMKLSFTPTDLAAGFPSGPEGLDRYLREEILTRKVKAGKVAKADLRKARLSR